MAPAPRLFDQVVATAVAHPHAVTTTEDTPAPFQLMGTDADGDALSYHIVTPPQHGTLTGTAPQLTYTPAPDSTQPDSFVFKVNDGQADSALVTVPITVTPTPDVPVAASFPLVTPEDQWANVTLHGTDGDGDALTFAIIEAPQNGHLSGTAPHLVYTPREDFDGEDSFTYVARDATSESLPAVVAITVTPVNDPPVAWDLPVTTDEDQPIAFTLPASDGTTTLSYELTAVPQHGTSAAPRRTSSTHRTKIPSSPTPGLRRATPPARPRRAPSPSPSARSTTRQFASGQSVLLSETPARRCSSTRATPTATRSPTPSSPARSTVRSAASRRISSIRRSRTTTATTALSSR